MGFFILRASRATQTHNKIYNKRTRFLVSGITNVLNVCDVNEFLNQNSETSLIMTHYGNISKRDISTLQTLQTISGPQTYHRS